MLQRFVLSVSLLMIGLSSCSLPQRHSDSGYLGTEFQESNSAVDFYQTRNLRQKQLAIEELGINPSQALNENDQSSIEQRLRLKRMEAAIPTKLQKQQYYRYQAFLKNDLDRILFLQIPTIEARERWVQGLGISEIDNGGYSDEMAKLIESNDIVIGMSQKAVTESWGDPEIVEVAGNPVYRNECWKYSKYVSSEDGYRREMRLIYFEGGRVVGWETM
jgi:hypothetical protein